MPYMAYENTSRGKENRSIRLLAVHRQAVELRMRDLEGRYLLGEGPARHLHNIAAPDMLARHLLVPAKSAHVPARGVRRIRNKRQTKPHTSAMSTPEHILLFTAAVGASDGDSRWLHPRHL